MSGSAALASARRRRAIPQKETNEIIEVPKQLQQQTPVSANPAMLLIKHNQMLNSLQNDIDTLKQQVIDNKPTTQQLQTNNDLEYYKGQHTVLLEEMREVKKTLLKVQTFAMETNLELMLLKKKLNVQSNNNVYEKVSNDEN